MIKILIVSPGQVYPRPTTGLAILLDVINVLKHKGCKIYLVQPGGYVNKPLFKFLMGLLNYEMYITLFRAIRNVNVIICYSIAHFIPALIAAKLTRKPLIITFGTLLSVLFYRYNKSLIQKVNIFLIYSLLAMEKAAAYLADRVIVVSEDDKKTLKSWNIRKDKIEVIPISIDLKRARVKKAGRIPTEGSEGKIKKIKANGNKIIMFHGNLAYPPNEYACKYIVNELAPYLLKECNNVTFMIVGPYPPKELVDKIKGVIFTGFVDNIFQYISLADITIAPLVAGGGIKNKILEYFSLSKPVITTSIGAEGLKVENMIHCVITDLKNFPKKLIFMLNNPDFALKMGHNARKYVKQMHSLKNYEKYIEVALEVCAKS